MQGGQLDLVDYGLEARTRGEIKAEMGRQDLSGSRLAKILGRGQTWVSRRLRGDAHLLLDDVEDIARVLAVPIEQLICSSSPSMSRRRRRAS